MNEVKNDKSTSFIPLSLLLIAVITLSALFFFNYQFPNGEEATLLGFIGIFFRELVILLIILVVLAIVIIERVRTFLKLKENNNA